MMDNTRRKYAGYGIKIKKENGNVRFTISHRTHWGWLIAAILYGITIITGGVFQFFLLSRVITEFMTTRQYSPFYGSFIGGFLLWLAVTLLVLYVIVWQSTGKYILEINNNVVKVGRRVLWIDFLSNYDAQRLRRIRFGPDVGFGRRGISLDSIGISKPNYKVFNRGRYTLSLDYGLKEFSIMNMSVQNERIPIIKRAIHDYFPELSPG